MPIRMFANGFFVDLLVFFRLFYFDSYSVASVVVCLRTESTVGLVCLWKMVNIIGKYSIDSQCGSDRRGKLRRLNVVKIRSVSSIPLHNPTTRPIESIVGSNTETTIVDAIQTMMKQ